VLVDEKSYGFEMAGFQSLLAVEKEPNIANLPT
jgi:hypothetical protein